MTKVGRKKAWLKHTQKLVEEHRARKRKGERRTAHEVLGVAPCPASSPEDAAARALQEQALEKLRVAKIKAQEQWAREESRTGLARPTRPLKHLATAKAMLAAARAAGGAKAPLSFHRPNVKRALKSRNSASAKSSPKKAVSSSAGPSTAKASSSAATAPAPGTSSPSVAKVPVPVYWVEDAEDAKKATKLGRRTTLDMAAATVLVPKGDVDAAWKCSAAGFHCRVQGKKLANAAFLLKGAKGEAAKTYDCKPYKGELFVRIGASERAKHPALFKEMVALKRRIHIVADNDAAWKAVVRKVPSRCRWLCTKADLPEVSKKVADMDPSGLALACATSTLVGALA